MAQRACAATTSPDTRLQLARPAGPVGPGADRALLGYERLGSALDSPKLSGGSGGRLRQRRLGGGRQLQGLFTEHWDGNSWSIVPTPSGVASLAGMTALSTGTVVAVGQGTNNSGIILSN